MENEGQPVETGPRESSWSRVVGALVCPRATFASIARKPSWLLPVVLLVLVNLVVAFSLIHTGALRVATEKQLASNPIAAKMNAQLTPEQRQANLDMQMRFAPVGAYAGAIVGMPVVLLIVALVFLGAFNIIHGTKIMFAQSFAVSAYAAMPSLLRSLVALVLVWARPPGSINLQSLSMSNLAVYLPTGAPVWLMTLGAKLDVFSLWGLGLLAVGYAAASSKKTKFGGALALVVAVWAIYVLASMGLAAASLSLSRSLAP